MKGKTARESALEEKVDQLGAMIAELQGRLAVTSGDESANGDRSSRRDMLKLVGAAAAGAAGTIVLRAVPAAATQGSAINAGVANTETAATLLEPDTGTTIPPEILVLFGQNGLVPPGGVENNASGAMAPTPVLLVVADDSTFPTNGGNPVLPGHAAIQSVAGRVTFVDTSVNPSQPYYLAEAIKGFASQPAPPSGTFAISTGVIGEADDYGVVGQASIDLAALGSGYVMQQTLLDNAFNPAAGPPPTETSSNSLFLQVRDTNGVLWLTNTDGSWRRMNSLIPIAPVRVIDTRSSQGSIGGVTGPLAANSVHTWTIGGTHGIPANAVGIIGNLTAITPQAAGFMTIYPTGQAAPAATSVNYLAGVPAMSNQCTVLLGGSNKTQVNIYVSGNGSTQCVLDVSGYII